GDARLGAVVDPLVDRTARGVPGVDEVDDTDARAVVRGQAVEECVLEVEVTLRPEAVRRRQVEARTAKARIRPRTLGKCQVQRVEGRVHVADLRGVKDLIHLLCRAASGAD